MFQRLLFATTASIALAPAACLSQAEAADPGQTAGSHCPDCLRQSVQPKDHPPHGTLTRRRHPAHHRQQDERCVSKHAMPSDTPAYTGYYVGGGAAVKGGPRGVNEGTWGWDYQGSWLKRKVALAWWHGRRAQGGTGAYKTDGPHIAKRLHAAVAP